MDLKTMVKEKILAEIQLLQPKSESAMPSRRVWMTMVTDMMSRQILSSCIDVTELVPANITLVQDLTKDREVCTQETVYFVAPCKETITQIVNELQSGKAKSSKAHIFFTQKCPDEYFDLLKKVSTEPSLKPKTLKQFDFAFIPWQQQVFTLLSPSVIPLSHCDRVVNQISSLCGVVGEHPTLQYWNQAKNNNPNMQNILQALSKKLAAGNTKQQEPGCLQSVVLILERGFDCITPLIRDASYTSVAYEMSSKEGTSISSTCLDVDERCEVWVALRHEHINATRQKVIKMLQQFTQRKKIDKITDDASVAQLRRAMQKMPLYQELTKYHSQLKMAEDCLKFYKGKTEKVREMAEEVLKRDLSVDEFLKKLGPSLSSPTISYLNKQNILLLYAVKKGGLTQDEERKIQKECKVEIGKQMVAGMKNYGQKVVQDGEQVEAPWTLRRSSSKDSTYVWKPVLQDIMEQVCTRTLNTNHFPVYGNVRGEKRVTNSRTLSDVEDKVTPMLIVYILGGMTFQEIRSMAEVSQQFSHVNILLGSDDILTPDLFIQQLEGTRNTFTQ